MVAIGIHDGWHALAPELSEQAQFGRKIGVHRCVIVEMVLCEIEEGHRRQVNAVEAELFEAVA